MKKRLLNYNMNVNNGEWNVRIEKKKVKINAIKQNYNAEYKLIVKLENLQQDLFLIVIY